ncbi:hypothetical protein [Desulfosediminicola ganghwensis]|uniref:hypothetical protein n=1 Tax=Desulfosediminicola ganghwensis TaxID=2569540 RepID=UPI001592C8A7|nr:hypothetical protein [Desulfosediminicola ganghwensis]
MPDSIRQISTTALAKKLNVSANIGAPPHLLLPAEPSSIEDPGFREKFQAKHSATDDHFARSQAEILVDNWLYMAEVNRSR